MGRICTGEETRKRTKTVDLGSSFDENGPMSPLGCVAFSAETGLPGGRQIFEVPAYLVASEESRVAVEYGGVLLSNLGAWNDYYGFGTSAQEALCACAGTLSKLEGCNADISVITTLRRRPCFPSREKPFYRGAQRVHYIPPRWRHENDLCRETEIEFLVWKNGERTPEALAFYDEIMRLAAEDAAPARNGDLRTVAKRREPTPRDAFLIANN